MAQQVKDLALLPKWLLLWHKFDSWPRNFHLPQVWPKKGVGGRQNVNIGYNIDEL